MSVDVAQAARLLVSDAFTAVRAPAKVILTRQCVR